MHPVETGWGLSYGFVFLRHGAPIPGIGPGRSAATYTHLLSGARADEDQT